MLREGGSVVWGFELGCEGVWKDLCCDGVDSRLRGNDERLRGDDEKVVWE